MKKILIILPGWGGTKETWKEFVEIAQKEYEVHCLNLPCFGDEPCPKEIWGVEEYAEFVKKQINKLSDKPIILLGHSFGGQVATYFTAHNPEMVEKLILIGAAVFRPKKALHRILFGAVAKVGKQLFKLPFVEKFDLEAKKLLYRAAHSPDYLETSGIKRDIFKKCIQQDLGYILGKISIPTLVVWGAKDSYILLKDGKKIADSIPHAQFEIFPEGKHGLHLQMPHELFSVIYRFIGI